jgi:dihydroorotate dehydrogenase
VHVAADSVERAARCCSRLSDLEEVAAVELGLPDKAQQDNWADLIAAANESLAQPLIVRLPLDGAEGAALLAEDLGADAITLGSGPPGTLYHRGTRRYVTGVLMGPFVGALLLNVLLRVRTQVSLPIIGSGGVWEPQDARTLLQAGCVAVQVDGALWRDPSLLASLADALAEESPGTTVL